MESSLIVAFVLGTLVFMVVPGPSVLFIVGRALALGKKAALSSVLGNLIGVLCMVVLVALGVGALLERFATALYLLKIVGGSYLVWLGWCAFHSRTRGVETIDADAAKTSTAQAIREGFVVGLTNPKALVFFAAVLPSFVSPDGPSPSLQIAVLGVVFCGLASSVDVLWALAAGSARQWFATSSKRIRRVESVGGLVLMGLGAGVVASARRI
jgi:threonine/homoserine/homoserine lactone efflux protein